GGTPRLINSLCDMALLTAFVDERPTVDETVMQAAVEELGWVPFMQRSGQRERAAAALVAEAAPELDATVAEVWGDGDIGEKVSRLYEFLPRMSAGLMSKMRLIEERLRAISEDL